VLSSDLQFIARALATGQILICAEEESGDLELIRTPAQMPEVNLRAWDKPAALVIDKPKEPWRRGRPLR
jgi:hypothetical protein